MIPYQIYAVLVCELSEFLHQGLVRLKLEGYKIVWKIGSGFRYPFSDLNTLNFAFDLLSEFLFTKCVYSAQGTCPKLIALAAPVMLVYEPRLRIVNKTRAAGERQNLDCGAIFFEAGMVTLLHPYFFVFRKDGPLINCTPNAAHFVYWSIC